MPIFDFVRGFLGLTGQERFNQNSGFRKPAVVGDDDDDDDDDDDSGNEVIIFNDDYRSDSPFWFNIFSGDMQDIHRYFQEQMNDIMKTFDSPWFGDAGHAHFFGIMDHDNIVDSSQPESKVEANPRNKFLKPSEPRGDFSIQSEGDKSKEVLIPHHRNGGGSGFFSGDPLEVHKFFEQQIDEIMKRFSSSSKWFHLDEGNSLELPDENHIHPRNKFFKPSYEQHQGFKADSDIDNESYAPKVFGKLLDKEPVQPSTFVSRSVMTSHQKKMLPNGGLEDRRKCIKDGKEEVTVSRQLGDLKHIVTTIKLPDGTTTKNEEFINFDEGQLGDFNKSWNKM